MRISVANWWRQRRRQCQRFASKREDSKQGRGRSPAFPVIHRRFEEFYYLVTTKNGAAFAPGTAPHVATTADLVALHGGRSRLLRVAEVAEQLGVCAATVYRLCERGALPHVRIVNSIRVRQVDLEAMIAGRRELDADD